MMIGPLGEASNKAHLVFVIDVIDSDTGGALDITGADITVSIRDPDTKSIIVSVTVGDGVVISESVTGRAQVTFTPDQMGALCVKTYEVGAVMDLDDFTYQLLIGKLSVLDGIVA